MEIKNNICKILNMEIGKKFNLLDLSISLREAGLLLKSNINTVDTIKLLSKTAPNKYLKQIFQNVYTNLTKGLDLFESFNETAKFDTLFLSLIKSGESSEKLSEVFLYLSSYYEKKYKLRQKIISIITYPILLLIITMTVLIFLLNNVVPMFIDIFTESNIDLPKVTAMLIDMSTFLKENYLYIILFIFMVSFLIKFFSKKDLIRRFFGKLIFKIPYINVHYQNYMTSIIAKNLTILLKGNVNIVESFKIINNSIENLYVKDTIENIIDNVVRGNTVSDALNENNIFSQAFINMIEIGESSENLVYILESATEYYEQKINYSVDKILQYLQPVLIVLISLFVAFIVFSIAIPIFDLSNGITIE